MCRTAIFVVQLAIHCFGETVHARSTQGKEMLRGEIESTDQAIDALVYQLYGLTEEEIKAVEGM